MYYWQIEIEQENKAQQKRWNGKVITTSKQWANNADGAIAPMETSLDKIWDAVNDYRQSRSWE